MTDWRHTRTDRLRLDVPVEADIDDLWAIHGDPATWTHFPHGVHPDRARSARIVPDAETQFVTAGLGWWSVRDTSDGPVVGIGGCSLPVDGRTTAWWNLYYRFSPAVQGRGYATETARTALAAAHDVDPERPVVAYLLEHNTASRRTAERLGLILIWRGPDLGNDDPDAVRLVFCDREPSAALADEIEDKFRPR